MLAQFYRIIWISLNFLVKIYEIFCRLKHHLTTIPQWSYDHWGSKSIKHEQSYLRRCRLDLNKIPRHLSIIIGPDSKQINGKVLSRIFAYATTMGINAISILDTRTPENGQIKLEKFQTPKGASIKTLKPHHFRWKMYFGDLDNLCNKVINGSTILKEQTPKFTNGNLEITNNGNGINNRGISVSNRKSAESHLNGKVREAKEDDSIEIYEISKEDGLSLLAEICREFFLDDNKKKLIEKLLADRSHLTEYIDTQLSKRGFFTDSHNPDLCIIFDSLTCTYGMLPWHLRFTEFHTHPPECYFNAFTFAQILNNFGNCEQRWGK